MACRTACDCRNPTSWNPTTDEPTCYSGCAASPCAYAILSQCRWQKPDVVGYMAWLYNITILWRECLFNGEYSARRGCGCIGGECADIDSDGGTYTRPMEFGDAEKPIGINDADYDSCSNCAWTPLEKLFSGKVWHLIIDGPPPGGYPDPPVGPTASLVLNLVVCAVDGVIGEQPIAAYVCNDTWNCLGRNTMTFHGCYDTPCNDLVRWLPKKLCVVPYGSNWTHPCGVDSPDICDCEDIGCPSFTLPMEVICGDPVRTVFEGTKVFTRSHDDCTTLFDSEFCSQVGGDFPDVPCGVFTTEPLDQTCEGSSDTRLFHFIVWCDGGDWKLRTYCDIDDGTRTVTQVSEIDLTRINVCEEEVPIIDVEPIDSYEPAIWFDDAEVDLTGGTTCCEECPPDIDPPPCCEDTNPLPATIYATITISGGCATSVVATLTEVATATWSGTAAIGSCGSVTVTAVMNDLGAGACGWTVTISNGASTCFTSGGLAANPCLVIPINRSGNWSNPPCTCCTNGASVSVDLSR